MHKKRGKPWTRNEILLALELYCRTSFGRITDKNPDIIELANLLERSPGAVAMKMCNLAHFDPTLQQRDVQGLANGSKLDQLVFAEYFGHLDKLIHEAYEIRKNLSTNAENPAEGINLGYDQWQRAKRRVGQDFFRMAVLSAYEGRCCVTGVASPELLIASHIKPWSKCRNTAERINPQNGLCLNAFHDRAYDAGLITVDPNGILVFSKDAKDIEMDNATRDWFMATQGKRITLPGKFGPDREFLEYHNEEIFIGHAL